MPPLAEVVSPKALNDLGSLLLTFLVTWAYMAWFQFMLIWIANLPVDIIYYLPRTSLVWLDVIWAIVLLHFAVPFFLLLLRPLKRHAGKLAWTAGLILFMHVVYSYYQITPMFGDAAPIAGEARLAEQAVVESGTTSGLLSGHWMDFLMPFALGGIWLSHFAWQLGRCPLLVQHDPRRAAALHLRRLDVEEAAQEEALAHE